MDIQENKTHWLVDYRFAIYRDGVVYDTKQARDIPYYIFQLRDKLINQGASK